MQRRPNVTTETATLIAQNVYGLTNIKEVKELCSFYDCNFVIKTPQKDYVLKVLNSYDSQQKDQIEAEAKAMRFLRNQGFPCPEIYTTKQTKDFMAVVDLNSIKNAKELCIVRLLEFLEGNMACAIDRSPALLFTIGRFVGSLSKVLKDFSHEGLESRKIQHFKWEILEFLRLDLYVDCFTEKNCEEVTVIRQVHNAIVHKVKPSLQDFRYGAVHNDLNGENMLITGPPYQVSAVLDFGDMVESVLISEISNAMVFFMSGGRGIEFSGYILSGYQRVFPLPSLERSLLYYFVGARLCQLVMYSKSNLEQHPDSEEAQVCYKKYWGILKEFWNKTKDEIECIWNESAVMTFKAI